MKTLWGSFEIRNVRLAKTMLTQFAGKSLEKNQEEFNTYADEFSKLPLYFLTFQGPQTFKHVLQVSFIMAVCFDASVLNNNEVGFCCHST